MALDYSTGNATPLAASPQTDDSGFYDVTRLRRQFLDYLGTKRLEIEEQKVARRYYNGSQWTAAELQILKKRGQPATTYNRVARKIDAVIGWIERLRQDPKAYPRTPSHEQGADVATAVLRYVLDHNEWKAKSPIVARNGAVDGIGGIEYDLVPSAEGDPDIEIHLVDADTFFYDQRSFRDGFSDARYLGVAKWVDLEVAKELVPEKAEELDGLMNKGASDLTTESDRDVAWVLSNENKVRLVDHWYATKRGVWAWCLYAGDVMLKQGLSPFVDERRRSFPKYRMFSAFIDQDGDRYGFVRNFKSAQDEINHRFSKALHMAHSRRLIGIKGAVDDIEKARKEWARADGYLEVNFAEGVKPEDQTKEIQTQFEFAQAAKQEIENFGPNPALVGQGLEDSSGRAIALLQQAGISELGPYLLAYKSWKTRVYRDIWNIVQQHWKAERWIRVTDNEDLAQFFKVNQLAMGPAGPVLQNSLGELDVDIIVDEGPDTVNTQADNAAVFQALGPQFTVQFPEVALQLAPLQGSLKKSMLDKLQQLKSQPPPPDPKVQAMQAQMQMQAQMDQQRLQTDQASAAASAQLEQQKAAADAQLKRDIAQAELLLKQQEMEMDFEHEHRKMMLGVQADREKAAIKVDGEKQVRVAQTSEPLVEANIAAIQGMIEQLQGMTAALTAPKRIVRDAAGKPVGVEVAA